MLGMEFTTTSVVPYYNKSIKHLLPKMLKMTVSGMQECRDMGVQACRGAALQLSPLQ